MEYCVWVLFIGRQSSTEPPSASLQQLNHTELSSSVLDSGPGKKQQSLFFSSRALG